MRDYLKQLYQIANHHPILCAGDVFDRWNSPPQLINFALDKMPYMYAIPGQHDLPYHGMEQIRSSAYWTLCAADGLYNVADYYVGISGVYVYAFPWGTPITPLQTKQEDLIHVALIHRYVWQDSKKHPGALDGDCVSARAEQLKGYDIAVFGDNHQPFDAVTKYGTRVYNCGAFMRRKADERNIKPSVGKLYSDGTIERVYLDTSGDRWAEDLDQIVEDEEQYEDLSRFLSELKQLESEVTDFREALRRAAATVPEGVGKLLGEVLDGTG